LYWALLDAVMMYDTLTQSNAYTNISAIQEQFISSLDNPFNLIFDIDGCRCCNGRAVAGSCQNLMACQQGSGGMHVGSFLAPAANACSAVPGTSPGSELSFSLKMVRFSNSLMFLRRALKTSMRQLDRSSPCCGATF
jgi:hypothetical protein